MKLTPPDFYRTQVTGTLPPQFQPVPPFLWIPQDLFRWPTETPRRVLIHGVRNSNGSEEVVPLLYENEQGKFLTCYEPEALAERILREDYCEGLRRTLEMRLPFNYSKLPSFIRKIGKRYLSTLTAKHVVSPVDFPGKLETPPVDWILRKERKWEVEGKSPFVVTYDVDSRWLFKHVNWLKRFLKLHQDLRIKGVWFCVPTESTSLEAKKALTLLKEEGEELACHGYNHDAKWPFVSEREFQKRKDFVLALKEKWEMRAFRSEWLWRDSHFLSEIASLFEFDSSVPTTSSLFSHPTGNGCGTLSPFLSYGGVLEFPVTLPMDDMQVYWKQDPTTFFKKQTGRVETIAKQGGMVLSGVHPQPHQLANDESFKAYEKFLKFLSSHSRLYNTTINRLGDWLAN